MWCSRPYSADSLDISEQPRARRVKFQGEQQEQQQQGERGRVVFAELNPAALVLEQKLTNSKTLTQGSKINLQSQEQTGSNDKSQGQEEVVSVDQSTNDIESSWDSDTTQEATEEEKEEWENWEDQEFTVENLKFRWSKL